MTDKKQCSKFKVVQPLNYYRDECKQCNICLESKRRYREQHKEALKQYAKEYYERKKEELNEKQNVKTECSVCKCVIRTYAMKGHETSTTSQWTLPHIKHNSLNNQPPHPKTESTRKVRDKFPQKPHQIKHQRQGTNIEHKHKNITTNILIIKCPSFPLSPFFVGYGTSYEAPMTEIGCA